MTAAIALVKHKPINWTGEEWLAARIAPEGQAIAERTISFVFDTFDSQGLPILSGYGAGPRDPDVERQLLEFASRYGATKIEVYDEGPLLRNPCCRPELQTSNRPDGSRTERWNAHDFRGVGPEGWHSRKYDGEGKIVATDYEWDDVRVGSSSRV